MRPTTVARLRRRHRQAPGRSPRLVTVAVDASAADALHRMQVAGQALALVVRGDEVVGVVDLEDLRFARDWLGRVATVGDATTMRVVERSTASW